MRCRKASLLHGVVLAGLALLPAGRAAADEAAGPRPSHAGEWLQHRGDRGLSGRSPLKGNISSPAVKWKRFLGVRETLLEVQFAEGGPAALDLPQADQQPGAADALLARWSRAQTVDPDGETAPRQRGDRTGKFIADRPGLQTIQFDLAGFCKLMARQNGDWSPVWQSEKINDVMQGLNTLTGDFDADGALEVAFVPWTNLYVLDLASGKLEGKARFYQEDALGDGRGYGWFGAFDLDGEGRHEFVIISDTQRYVSVLGWREGELKFLWGRKFQSKSELTESEEGTIVHVVPNPVQDVDGDGLPEIVVSRYAEGPGERQQVAGRWLVEILDGRSGRTRLELPDQRLSGLWDLDGDNVPELLCTGTAASGTNPQGLAVYGFKQGVLVERWQLAESSYQMQRLAVPPDFVANGTAAGNVAVLAGPIAAGGRPAFFTRKALDPLARLTELTAWQADPAGTIRQIGRIAAPLVEAVAVASDAAAEQGLLVKVQVPERSAGSDAGAGPGPAETDRVELTGVLARSVCSRRVPEVPSPVLVGRLTPDSPPALIAQGAGERIVAFELSANGTGTRSLWSVPGRGMHEGSYHRSGGAEFSGVNLADLRGDGRLATVLGRRGPADQARLAAVDPDGQEIWHRDFDMLPGGPPGFTLPGLSFWFAGRFTDRGRDDILAAVKSGVGTRLVLLDGRSGREIWNRFAGGMYMAVCDYDGDGLDDAVTTCWSEVHVLHGATGKSLLQLSTVPPGLFGDKVWPADAYCCAVDLLSRGKPQIVYWPSYAARGLVGTDGALVWKFYDDRLFFGTASVYPGLGDFDGDGTLELLAPGDHPGPEGMQARCFDAATGSVRWALPIADSAGQLVGSAVTADLDGDGRDEGLFAVGPELYAVGATSDGTAGEIRWKLPFPATIGPVVLADAAGDGSLQIVVPCADGYVYGVGQ